MLTRVLFALIVTVGFTIAASAQEAKVLALGVTDHEVTQEEVEKGAALPVPRFNSPAIAYILAADLKKGDTVEVALFNEDNSLLHNTQTLSEDQAKLLLQAGKRGVPAGGWPEGSYSARVTVTRDGKTLIEQSSKPVAFE
jgi:hypothetical protein